MSRLHDLREAILNNIDDDLYDREVLPHVGLVPDWFPRYMRLKDMIEEYFDQESQDSDN